MANEKTQPEVVDRSVMREITAGDEALERELFREFRKLNAEDAALLRSGVVTRDVEIMVHSSHRMKGAARALGARQLALACEHLERAARDGQLDAAHEIMPALEDELHLVNVFLDRLETQGNVKSNNAAKAAQSPGETAHERE